MLLITNLMKLGSLLSILIAYSQGIEVECSFVDPFCFHPGHQLVDLFRHRNIICFV